MQRTSAISNKSIYYATAGVVLGVCAPVFWMLIRLILFHDPQHPLLLQMFADVVATPEHTILYLYMGVGTALVMGLLGYLVGRAADEAGIRAVELKDLHREVAAQKELFENRYKVLDNNIKNFHQISSRIQKSIDADEVISLCADGLHEILGYERVNVLLANEDQTELRLVVATGTGLESVDTVTIPLDERIGVIYKAFSERRVILVDDMVNFPADFRLQSPYDSIEPLRSNCFVLCPIIVRGRSIGLFGIDNKFSHRSLNDTDADTVKLFADQAASAMSRINLLRSIDTLTKELESTFHELLRNREFYYSNLQNLKMAIDSLANATTHIATGSEGIMHAVDETSSAVLEISVAVEQVSRNLDALTGSVFKSASALEEINATLQYVQQNAGVSHGMASQVKQQADQGLATVVETIDSLNEIQHAVEFSYEGIKRLSENSGRIGGIINVINEITKRTNLLALNASIIAAQAGEFGRSFGVVADEIRNLSLQTGQSTGEITTIIEEIMNESRNAAESVTATRELVLRGVTLGQETGDALRSIVNSSTKAMEMTEEMKQATEEQSSSINLVTRSIEDVSSMAAQIFNSSKEQATSTRSISRSIESIKERCTEMAAVTNRQAADTVEIRKAVEATGAMVMDIFADMEMRRDESSQVIRDLEVLKDSSR